MDEQTNDQVQAVRQDVEDLKDQLAKILELLTTGRGKSVTGASSQVEVNLNQYNIDMASDRLDLQRMEKKNVETFKEYAQRWRELASQVQPPLTNKELTAMFINTLWVPYYDRMVGSASTNFSDIITIGERIEFGVKNGRIFDPVSETRRMMTPKKKEGEVHELSSIKE
ncbi:uncharacterized protein E5676_scaffold98G003080 [Cucumis melo var. makuwa]|uniref:Gag-pro-like protein n=1 Tax=Cucumis melo var. makuwa TaxID=1194695 RepID=A0A5D3C3K5_CUCMM|nr:uncharacterized protein E5676_scaffold98G003080 [Cucumis melo var. makuwa]